MCGGEGELILQCVKKGWQELQREMLSQLAGKGGFGAQGGEFGQPPGGVVAHDLLNVPEALAGLVAQPVDISQVLGFGGWLDLVEDGWVELEKRGEPVVAGEVGLGTGEFLAWEGAEFGEDAEIVEKA